MSESPLDPSTDPLLAELGQLGVPRGGLPAASGAALLAQAAVTPVVIGWTGLKLYGLLATAMLLGAAGGAALLSPPSEPARILRVEVPVAASTDPSLDDFVGPAPRPWTEPPAPTLVPSAPTSPRIQTVYRTAACPEPEVVYVEVAAAPTDNWIPEPEPAREPEVVEDERVEEPVVAEEEPLQEQLDAPVDRVDAPPTTATRTLRSDRPTGHLHAGLGGGAFFPEGEHGSPQLAVAGGASLVGPGVAAPVLGLQVEGGLANVSFQALGHLGVDGSFGLALRPARLLRLEFAGLGGVRLLETVVVGQEDPEERERGGARITTAPRLYGAFGGRVGFVIEGGERSPLAFRFTVHGQGLARASERGVTVLPAVGGTLGVEVLLPQPGGN